MALFVSHLVSGVAGSATVVVETVGFDVTLVGIPLSIALAMARYRLYSVDAVVDSSLAWLAASGVLLVVLSAIVLVTGLLADSGARWSPLAVAGVSAVAVVVARPLHAALQRGINRRFHRRAFDAVRAVDAYVERLRRGEASLDDLEDTLRRAIGDPGLEVAVPVGEAWVRPDGSPTAAASGATHELARDGMATARLVTSTLDADDRALREAAEAARLALENLRLRAQTVVQLAEVQASRGRIVAAQYAERRRHGRRRRGRGRAARRSLPRGPARRALGAGARRPGPHRRGPHEPGDRGAAGPVDAHGGAHVASILAKLGLPESPEDHRRVLAVLSYLRDGA